MSASPEIEGRHGYVLDDRLQKLDELRHRGIEPFAYSFDATHSTRAARTSFEAAEAAGELSPDGFGTNAWMAGRLVSLQIGRAHV